MEDTQKTIIELWDGYEAEVDLTLMEDFDFVTDFNAARKANDVGELVEMYMALIGGDETYQDVRAYLTEKHGRVTVTGMTDIIERINAVLPKAGNRASRRSRKISR